MWGIVMAFCKKCLLPDKVPGAGIDRQGICRSCRELQEQTPEATSGFRGQEKVQDLEEALQSCRGQGEYDCLVPVSGGKDSLYLLYKLKQEYDLNILAFTTDVNIPDLAWKNIKRTLQVLDIDHLAYAPSAEFYKKLFRHLLQNQEERGAVYTVSYVYAPLFEGDAIRIALQKNIPLILAGYSPGQPEPERMLYEFSRRLICDADWTPPALRESGEFSEAELSRFFNPSIYPQGTQFPRYLAPFHAWDYDQQQAMQEVFRSGLVKRTKHANPILTNYPINWLLMYSDLKSFGYNPYHPEFSALIREGKASKRYWQIMIPVVNTMISKKIFLGREVKKSLDWLGLDEGDLRITQPKGAYDPVF